MRSTSRHGQNRVAGRPRKYGVGASQLFNGLKLGVAGIMPVTARKSVVPAGELADVGADRFTAAHAWQENLHQHLTKTHIGKRWRYRVTVSETISTVFR